MVQLTFDATQYPPDTLDNDSDTTKANTPLVTWNPNPTTQLEYIAACKARLQLVEAANKRWRTAVRAMQAAKLHADELRDAWHEIKNTKPPRSPYADIILSGGSIDPDLANE